VKKLVKRSQRRREDDVILNRQNERIWPKLMLLRIRSWAGGGLLWIL